jgi:ABC-type transport system involved in multi-copper enzyme maturation permease subunit
MSTLKALLWKDYRVNRLILIVGLVLLIVPHLIAWIYVWRAHPPRQYLQWTLLAASAYSVILSQLTLTLLGGNAIAAERVDRSAEFLGYLPPSRAMIIGSKALLAFVTALVIWGVNLVVFCLVVPWEYLPKIGRDAQMIFEMPLYVAATGTCMFGIAWLGSSCLASPTFAIFGGLVSPLVLHLSLISCSTGLGWPAMADVGHWYVGISLALGCLCFVSGTLYYLRRVEP